jgi:lysozyme family protein
MTFDESFERLVDPQHEGAVVVNNPNDPGGLTKYGISKRSYPSEDIANLTLDRAKQIYQRDFWGPAGCDALPDLLKYEMFDLAVNTSAPGHPVTAIKLLQQAVGSFPDGVLGPNTLQAVGSMDAAKALRRLQAYRMRYYTGMVTWPAFGKGWVNRIAENMLEA